MGTISLRPVVSHSNLMFDSFSSFSEEYVSEDWGYKFTGRAIDSFIRDIEGEAAKTNYPEFRDRRDRAEQLMFDLFSQTSYLFYVRRIEQGHNLGEQKWELILATDFDDLELPAELEERGSTLKLVAIVNNDGSGGLRIIYARLRHKREGTKDSFAKSFYLRLRSNYQYRIGVPLQAIELMANMPFKQDCIPTEQQLEAWKAFTKVEERIAKEKQFCVPFVSHNYGEATRNITFAIDAESVTVDSQDKNSITLDDFWRRAKRARNQNIKLKENNSSNSDEIELGTIESIDFENNFLRISLDSEIFDLVTEGHYTLPQEGLLSFEAVGDVVQTRRKKQALRNLERGRTQNPYLGQFLFDASQAREPREVIQIQPQDLLLENTNSSQKAAVETVLSAPDLALIQGPPGTGKTTVIAEICYQVALRGGRTLIASQANLAVDNALSRLQHNPTIRAVRKGNKNSVGLEGEPFIEENVIKTWLQNTSADCEQRLNEKLNKQKVLNKLADNREEIDLYISEELRLQSKCKRLKQCQEKIQWDSLNLSIPVLRSFHKLQSLCPSLDHIESLEEDYQLVYSTIEQCRSKLQDWSLKSYEDIKRHLTDRFEHRKELQIETIDFPNFDFTNDFDFLSEQTKTSVFQPKNAVWKKGVNDYVSKINTTIKGFKIWDRAYTITNELDRTISQVLKDLTTKSIDKNTLEALKKKLLLKEYREANVTAESTSKELINLVLVTTNTWLDETKELFEKSQHIEEEKQKVNEKLQELHENVETKRAWWKSFYENLPDEFQLEISPKDLFTLDFLNYFKSHLDTWLQELEEVNTYLNRYQHLLSDWIERLKNPSEQNRQELKRIYLDNANVIGITCSQSARGDFSREFESFDVVIIDEVSKCTPPELLIPALKAKKLVLVGDHRQLPPMLDNVLDKKTIVEIAEELGTTTEELNYLKESLFKNLFESAPKSIEKMLTIQYRMHPQIMAAINQFYEDNLECGLTNSDEQRAHDIANHNIKDNNHIVWIKTPQNRQFREEKDGTSWINRKEIEVIEKVCQQFEQTWSLRVKQGEPRKEIGIITFYGRQLKLIESRIDPKKFPSLHIRTGTVDRFQGMEKQVIIVSMVRNNNRKDIGFAKKPERVNVAFSRAQELLVIIGCHSLFTQFPIYSKVSDVIRLYGGLIDVLDILR